MPIPNNMNRIFANLINISILLALPVLVLSQKKTLPSIEKSVESLRDLMIQPESKGLDYIFHDSLSYGHSSGLTEGKASLIKNLISGNSDFISMEITEQKVIIQGNTAIVRHRLSAITNDKGIPGQVNLKILLVWMISNNVWKLIARQAVKVNN